jgi:iron complex transport system permease protein
MASLRFLFLLILCLLTLAASLRLGGAEVSFDALLNDRAGLLSGRAFRSLCAMAVGAALAVSGLMLQSLTANPLADPGITGINAGAALLVVATAQFVPDASMSTLLIAAICGAGLAGLTLWALAGGEAGLGRDGIALRLPLAGLAIEAFCLSLAMMLILSDAETQARYVQWIVGAIPPVARSESIPLVVIATALLCGAFLTRRLSLFTLGADQSKSLGRDPRVTVSLTLGLVTVLSGASVAIAGPIAFVGLLVPFVVRRMAQTSLMAAYGHCVVLGASTLMACDVLGRVIARPGEVDAGIIMALAGGIGLIIMIGRLLPRDPKARV